MRFQNPANGHVENKSVPWLWALLFGIFYFLVSGLWTLAAVWLLLVAGSYAALGPAATVVVFIANLVFAAFAPSAVRSNYLRKGWVEVLDGAAEAVPITTQTANDAPNGLRKCPFCAEDIRAEAIKCKHCGSEVEPLATT